MDPDDVESIEKVCTELVGFDLGLGVPIRTGDDPELHHLSPVGAYGADLSVFQDPEEFSLERHGHLGDLIQKDRATIRLCQQPLACGSRAGEGTSNMAEQFALQQRFRDAGAIDSHEAAGAPGAVVVDGLGYQLLPRAALARDEDVEVASRCPLDKIEYLLHEQARPDEIVEAVPPLDLAPKRFVLATEPCIFQRAIEGEGQLLHLEWLGHVIKGPSFDSIDGRRDRGEGCDDDHHGLWLNLAGGLQDLHPVEVRHAQIRHHGIHRDFAKGAHPRRTRGGGDDLKAALLQLPLQQANHLGVVVNHKHSALRHAGPLPCGTAAKPGISLPRPARSRR